MIERLEKTFKSIPKIGQAIWDEYLYHLVSAIVLIKPLHFTVTRFKSGIKRDDKVLELVSGYPWYELYADKVGKEGLFVALDSSLSIQKRSRSIGKFIDKFLRRKEEPTVNHLVASISFDSYLPFPDNTFDHVLVNQERHDPKEVFRVLKPGGEFLISYSEPFIYPILTVNDSIHYQDFGFENIKTRLGAPTTFIYALASLFWRGGDLPVLFSGLNWYISAKKPVEQETKL